MTRLMRFDSLPLWRTEYIIYAFIFSYFHLILLPLKLLKTSSHRIYIILFSLPYKIISSLSLSLPLSSGTGNLGERQNDKSGDSDRVKTIVVWNCATKSFIAGKYLATAHSSLFSNSSDPNESFNTPPISLLPIMSKVWEGAAHSQFFSRPKSRWKP